MIFLVKPMDEYPDDIDLKVTVEEKLSLKDTRDLLQDESHLLVNTNNKESLSVPIRQGKLGHQTLNKLSEKVLDKDSEIKSTSFYLESPLSNEELRKNLESYMRSGENLFDDNINLRLSNVRPNEDRSFSVMLKYDHRMPARRSLLNSKSRDVTIDIGEEITDNTRIIEFSYRYNDQRNTVTKFLETWRRNQVIDRIDPVKILNVDLTLLSLSDRIGVFDAILDEHPGDWAFERITELGIERQESEGEDLSDEEREIVVEEKEEMETRVEQNLQGLTKAVLQGRNGLRESEFVQECIAQDFYFTSANIFFTHTHDISGVEVRIEFKQSPKPTFAVSFVEYYERDGESYVPESTSGNLKESVRDLFRGLVMNIFATKTDQSELIQSKYTKPLTDLEGIGPKIADRLSEDLGMETHKDVFDADPEDLQQVEGIGKSRAKSLSGQG